jgi:hypothetical protein
LGYRERKVPLIFDSEAAETYRFPSYYEDMLALLAKAYDYPVDIEYTAKFLADNQIKINLLQCRPCRRRAGQSDEIPKLDDKTDCFFSLKGNFMGGNIRLPIDNVVHVDAQTYKSLSEQNKYAVARQIGAVNTFLKDKGAMIIGPGRWEQPPRPGSAGPFHELCNMSDIMRAFVHRGRFYARIIHGATSSRTLWKRDFLRGDYGWAKGCHIQPEQILRKEKPARLHFTAEQAVLGSNSCFENGWDEIFSDIVSQTVICR